MIKNLQIDDTWTITYDTDNNCLPVDLLRHSEFHSVFKYPIPADYLSMFYALLDEKTTEPERKPHYQAYSTRNVDELMAILNRVMKDPTAELHGGMIITTLASGHLMYTQVVKKLIDA